MKTLTKLMFGAVLTLSSTMTMAKEGGVGNGGGVHWCQGKAPEMYDVYEGKRRYKLNIVDDGSRYEDILEKALGRIKGFNATLAQEIEENIKFLDNGGFSFEEKMKLHLIPDANVLMTDENCEYRQLANWDDVTKRVFVKNEYYEKMSDLNKAALTLHEAIYAVSRKRLSATNSDSSRRVVAELLATKFEVSANLKTLTKVGDVMVKDMAEGVTEDFVSEENIYDSGKALIISQKLILDVHAGSMDIARQRDKGEIIVKFPKLQAKAKELAEVKKKLQDHNSGVAKLARRDRKNLESRQYEIEGYLRETSLIVVSTEGVDGVFSLPLTLDTIVIGGSKLMTAGEDLEAIIEFRLVDGNNKKKTFTYKKTVKLAASYFSRIGTSSYSFMVNFSQNK